MTFVELLIAFVAILIAAVFFTNSVEVLGDRLDLGHGAVGSLLAALGTALPETMIPVVAILGAIFSGRDPESAAEIGIGAILGAPFLLATLGMFVVGASVFTFRSGRANGSEVRVEEESTGRDVRFFFVTFGVAVGAGIVTLSFYLKAFRRLSGKGYEVLCISPTSAVTRMCEAASQARDLAREEGAKGRIEIVDSGAAAMAQGFLALEAARLASQGAGMDEIVERVHELSGSVRLLVTLDTLEYLAKTHRISGIGALFGKALQVKAIILFGQGKVKPLERPRTRRRAMSRLLDLMEVHLRGGSPLHVAVQHAAALEEARALRSSLVERFGPQEVLTSEFSPVMTSYTGPGLLGLAFYEDAGGIR